MENLINFINNLTIKNQKRADMDETVESAKKSREFLLAYTGRDDFFSYDTYSRNELKASGIGDEEELDNYIKDPSSIPERYRVILLEKRREKILDEYVELNNYYRMLNGLPDIDEESLRLKSGKLVTDLTEYECIVNKQELKNLITNNPELEYLRHLGNRKVDFYEARTAKGFYLLNYEKHILEEERVKKFIELYYESMVYVTSIIYTDSFKSYDHYDNFITLLIVFVTMQKFVNEQLNYAIRRDFYDLESIKNTFLSYGLPFYEEIPLKYQRRFIKNINQLLKYKATDPILVDIVDLFGFSNVELFKYYLIKDFRRTSDGVPILDGETDIDNYVLKFAQIPLKEKDVASALQQTYLYQSYEEVTGGDPYWGLTDGESTDTTTDEFKEQLLMAEFNYVNTKYMSMNTMFNMGQANAETCYFFNLMNSLQSKGLMDEIQFINNDIKMSGNYIKVFDVITAIFILLYKRFGYDDNIIYTPTAIGSLFGFNFDTDIEILKEKIKDSARVDFGTGIIEYDFSSDAKDVLEVFKTPEYLGGKADIIDMFFNNKSYGENLKELINKCDNYQEFKALDAIYTYNMYSQAIADLYDNGENMVYSTYTEYLMDNDIELYEFVEENSSNKENIIKTLDTLLLALEIYFNTEKFEFIFSSLTNISGELIKKYMLKMINVFKAYTVELKKINVYYVFDDKFFNMIRLFTLLRLNIKETISDFTFKDLYEESKFKLKHEKIDKSLEELRDLFFAIDTTKINEKELQEISDKIATINAEFGKAESFIEDLIDILSRIKTLYRDEKDLVITELSEKLVKDIESDILFLENINNANKELSKSITVRLASFVEMTDLIKKEPIFHIIESDFELKRNMNLLMINKLKQINFNLTSTLNHNLLLINADLAFDTVDLATFRGKREADGSIEMNDYLEINEI